MEYKPITNVLEIKETDWLRMNKLEYSSYDIEWTFRCGGWIRVKLSEEKTWTHEYCPFAEFAETNGIRIVERLERKLAFKKASKKP